MWRKIPEHACKICFSTICSHTKEEQETYVRDMFKPTEFDDQEAIERQRAEINKNFAFVSIPLVDAEYIYGILSDEVREGRCKIEVFDRLKRLLRKGY